MKMFKRIIILITIPALLASLIPVTASASSTMCDQEFYLSQDIRLYDPCAEDCSLDSIKAVNTLTGTDNREKIWNYLIAKGLSSEQAAGVLGNIRHESGYSPFRQEMSKTFPSGGWGIVQWTFGRRTNVVEFVKSKVDVFDAYYINSHGHGVNEASGFVPEGVPVDVNDKFLLAELDFLYKESSELRVVSSRTVPKLDSGSAVVGDNEWEALKKQKTIEGASNLWVYNFEIPASIDATAAARVESAKEVYQLYSSGSVDCDSGSSEIRNKVVSLAEEEYSLWESGVKGPGTSYLEYTYDQEHEWCAHFVSWIFNKAGKPLASGDKPTLPAVSQIRNLAEKDGEFKWQPNDGTYTPQPGDIAIYQEDGAGHTNIVISATSPTDIVTIGGNEGYGDGTTGKDQSKVVQSKYWGSQVTGYAVLK